jgi:U3 small nucleolar RNA-associated protein 21
MSEQKVFTFSEFEHEGNITCLEQSPVVDIVAVGFESGAIVLLNLLYNEQLLKFNSGGPVKALTFSSDTSLGVSLLASIT